MRRFRVSDVLTATGGKLLAGDARETVAGISIDTRTIRKGELYIAIVGKNLDGHRFEAAAMAAGASGVVVNAGTGGADVPGIKIAVPDTTRALGDIAAWLRLGMDPIVVAVTGSNGKSTTKELLASILAQRYKVLKPKSSYNNDIGVPLTVLELTPATRAAVIEMEMNELGGIRRLCEIARPQVGIVTNIGDTHLEFLKDRRGVAREKSELIEFLDGQGTAVLNADDPLVTDIGRKFPTRETITFGVVQPADIFATRIEERGLEGVSFRLNGQIAVLLPLAGAHNVLNALAATAAAQAVGMRLYEIVIGLESCRALPLRLQAGRCAGMTLIVDCYNANPQSMAAALRVLQGAGPGRKVAVLGEMLELGFVSSQAHFQVGRQAGGAAGIVLATGSAAASLARGARAAGIDARNVFVARDNPEAVQKLIDILRPGDTILLKGSRANRMEEIVRELRTYYETRDKTSDN